MIFWAVIPVAMTKESVSQIEGANPQQMVIDMESHAFTPAELTIERGKPVTLILRNQSFLVPHNFLLENPHGVRILEADISSGESQAHVLTLNESGIYPFYCDKQLFFFPTHREEGMEGRLIVP
jgi:plastocyanin